MRTPPYLSDHAVPLPVDVLAVPAVGHQVQVVGEAHDLGQPLQHVDAEAFAAVLHGPGAVHHQAEGTGQTGAGRSNPVRRAGNNEPVDADSLACCVGRIDV